MQLTSKRVFDCFDSSTHFSPTFCFNQQRYVYLHLIFYLIFYLIFFNLLFYIVKTTNMNYSSFLKFIVSISLCFMLFSCSNTKKNTLPNPEIKDGIAKVSGKITDLFYPQNGNEDNRTLILLVSHPVTGERFYEVATTVGEEGAFSFEVPMQCNYAIGLVHPKIDYYDTGFYVSLTSGKETKIEITFEQTRFYFTNQTDSLGLTSNDQINMFGVSDMLNGSSTPGIIGYAKTPDKYVHRVKIIQNYRLKRLSEKNALSEIAKNYVANGIKMYMLDWPLLEYKRMMQIDYLNAGNENLENYNPPEPDKKYYTFLKDFNLNNPQYLYEGLYPEVLQKILSNETLNIPPIEDTPINQWMKGVRNILSKLVGFDKGLFYDLLASNSYARQFDNELRPLSEKQIENINNYFKEEKGEFAKILLKKNDEIIKLAAMKEQLAVNETPAVSKEKLMETIISKYKGKVVVVDFWATWCEPCLDAMTEYRTIKGELKGKDVVFVYLTNSSSPKNLWKEKIKGIGGEHYYLNNNEWEYLMKEFNFNGIPSYVIFDTQGKVRQQFSSYPGNEKMQKMIEELLP